MKKLLIWLLLAVLLLCSCGGHGNPNREIKVCIEEGYGFSVEENGLSIQPGEDAQFVLRTQRGISITGADYAGEYQLSRKKGVTALTLKEVLFPTRIHLTVSSRYCTITYYPSGGQGAVTEKTYDLSRHCRPNTSIGTDLFFREGYTLTGWNTMPDGSGLAVGLGSRVSVPEYTLNLYAQWAKWGDASDFECVDGTITAYHGAQREIVIPEILDGQPVTAIASGAFDACPADSVIFPKSLKSVESGAFRECDLSDVLLFDNIVSIPDDAFLNCPNLQTLHINAIEAPYGYLVRKESCYADKIDLLIHAQGQKKLVCYGGCSMWYNLDGGQFQRAFGEEYRIINLGLNGTVTSTVQLQILTEFLEEGDILFHTPELSSRQQLLLSRDMGDWDERLWCGLENNYDLFALVDLREVGGVFGSLSHYLASKTQRTTYDQVYVDDDHQTYLDRWGCVPIARVTTQSQLADSVTLDPSLLCQTALDSLKTYYDRILDKGTAVYLSYACVNMDAVPEAQRENVERMDTSFREAVEEMDGPVLVSVLSDYLYHENDFFDTNYHLLGQKAQENTAKWVQDLSRQLESDGLWRDTP